jgi:hypothetical protein
VNGEAESWPTFIIDEAIAVLNPFEQFIHLFCVQTLAQSQQHMPQLSGHDLTAFLFIEHFETLHEVGKASYFLEKGNKLGPV